MKRILVAALSFALTACGSSLSGGFSEAGASAGGAKDLSRARAKLAKGEVPRVEDFTFEGMFSEHDLPIGGPACNQLLCIRAGSATAPDVDASNKPAAWVQLGMSSNVDLSRFKRPNLNAAIVLDNSGSMGTDKMEAAKAAAEKLIDLLGPDDLLTVVRFDSFSQVLIGPEPVSDKERFKAVVRKIHAGGSTCIECGLKDAFGKLKPVLSGKRANRVFLFTDAMPNVGATGEGEFMKLLEGAANDGLFTSVFGVGLDFGQALATRITSVRGANYAFLATAEQVSKVFDEDFDMLVTPIAFDLTLTFQPKGMSLASVYGVPARTRRARTPRR